MDPDHPRQAHRRTAADDQDSQTTAVDTAADLELSISESVDPVFAGDPMSYTISLDNDGPSDATGAEVAIDALTLPAGVSFTGDAGDGSYSGGAAGGTRTVSVAAGATASRTFDLATASSAPAGTDVIAMSGQLSALAPGVDSEIGGRPDSAAETTSIEIRVDMEVASKASCPGRADPSSCAVADEVSPGQPMTWEVVVTNNGPSDAVDASLTDPLSSGLDGAIWSCTPSSASSKRPCIVATSPRPAARLPRSPRPRTPIATGSSPRRGGIRWRCWSCRGG